MKVNFLEYILHTTFPEWPPKNQIIINTINPHSYCVAKKDLEFKNALQKSEILIPDGIGIVWALRVLKNIKIQRIAGADMHKYLLNLADKNKLKVFYLGASKSTLALIEKKVSSLSSSIKVQSYSPPYKAEFSREDNLEMVKRINAFSPDILFVGMTAPKQEKWVFLNRESLDVKIIASIGAVFDFYAGTVKRAPSWFVKMGMEWLYRLVKEPKRLWRRYLINNNRFVFYVLKCKYFNK